MKINRNLIWYCKQLRDMPKCIIFHDKNCYCINTKLYARLIKRWHIDYISNTCTQICTTRYTCTLTMKMIEVKHPGCLCNMSSTWCSRMCWLHSKLTHLWNTSQDLSLLCLIIKTEIYWKAAFNTFFKC